MAYIAGNPKSKAELKRWLAAGKSPRVYDVGIQPDPPRDGIVDLEGPHYPAPHTWYGTGTMKNGLLVEVK